ncbi:MAG: hypothetical protein ACSHYF_16680 [Verrucomicrobiaceae bacterium]
MDWQTPTALAIVALTLIALIRSAMKKKGCGGSCDCPAKSNKKN